MRLKGQSDRWSSQDSVDTLSPRLVSRFELLGAHAAEMTMATRAIVERLDIVGHVSDRKCPGLIDLLLDPLLLQAAEELLGHGIVPAIHFTAHARL